MAKSKSTTPALHIANDDDYTPTLAVIEDTATEPEIVTRLADTIPYVAPPKDYLPAIVASLVGLVAVTLGVFGLVANASFLGSFGAAGFSAVLLTALGVCIELLAMVLPMLAAVLSARKDRHGLIIAWSIWGLCVALVLINSCGFSSRFIGDGVFAREQVTDSTTAKKAELAALRAQRQAVHELRSVAELDATLATLKPNGKAHERASVSRAEAIARDTLDGKISTLESTLASAPAIASADPGAATAANIVKWLTAGIITPSEHDFATLRIIILTLLPCCAGALLNLSTRSFVRA
jgi:hypothetical protein